MPMRERREDIHEDEAPVREWGRRAAWPRRLTNRLGLQGKLLVCFTALLSLALGVSCWIFLWQSGERLADALGEQARQMSYALSLAARSPITDGRNEELRRMGNDLIKSRNVLFVAFLDADYRPVALASRDPDFDWATLLRPEQATLSLMQVREEHSALFGDYLAVSAPVLSLPSQPAVLGSGAPPAGSRLLGYVTVGLSPVREQAQLRRINLMVMAVGTMIAALGMPLAWVLVHRVFQPIRELVAATRRLAEGDLEAQVAIHRPDMIGTLARSFNRMAQRVKAQQQALAASNRDLEEKVRQRTAQLEAANQRLSSEISEKEDFLRAVSHDLNAPLRNIGGMTSMLLMKHRDHLVDEAVHKLERIQKNVEIETGLISELLELSRIKTRRQKLEMVDIDALVRELGGMFESDLNGRGIELVIEQRLPVLRCEKARLRQVFQNLIDNAIKYMGTGRAEANGRSGSSGAELGITTFKSEISNLKSELSNLESEISDSTPSPSRSRIRIGCVRRGGEAEFYVSDTGIGIHPEDQDKIFCVFRRGKQIAGQQTPGKGLGLASVKSIVETYQGRIWVESEPGRGSTFRFTINGQYLADTGRPAPAAMTDAVSEV